MTQVAETCFELLHIEIVDYFKRQCVLLPSSTNPSINNRGGRIEPKTDEKKINLKKLHMKLVSIGHHVGQRLAERLTRDQPRFGEPLEVIKFICKDFWIAVFRKQVDKLQTNYKGIYVLHDFNFRWLARISSLGNVVEEAKSYTFFACGVIKGALSNLGLNTTVKAEIAKLPNCQFTIIDIEKTKKDEAKQKNPKNLTLTSLPSLSSLKPNPNALVVTSFSSSSSASSSSSSSTSTSFSSIPSTMTLSNPATTTTNPTTTTTTNTSTSGSFNPGSQIL